MKKAQFDLNMAVSVEMNKLRLYRWINRYFSRYLSRWTRVTMPAGSRRYRMAQRANGKRLDQDRQFRFNAFRAPTRNPYRKEK